MHKVTEGLKRLNPETPVLLKEPLKKGRSLKPVIYVKPKKLEPYYIVQRYPVYIYI